MKTNVNVLMIDDNQSICSKTMEYFSRHAVINVVKAINNGKEAIDYIKNNYNEIDLILMDIIMPETDGITILEEMRNYHINKKVIIMTSYKIENTIKMVSEYDIDYYMVKPIDMFTLEKRILNLIKPKENKVKEDKTVEIEINHILHELGIPSHIRGFQYVRESIYYMYLHPEMIGGITKCVYPEIALRHGTTATRVERAIRHAIEVSWARGDYDLMDELFGHSVDFDRSKPTNSEFIVTIADTIRLKQKVKVFNT